MLPSFFGKWKTRLEGQNLNFTQICKPKLIFSLKLH